MKNSKLAAIGNFLGYHQKTIRSIQWIIILLYAFLIIVPAFLPLPNDSATIIHNLTVFAQFIFWGIWWPFVLLSIILFGRLWCGVLCPEGALSELANRYGKKRTIPRWLKWGGWPFVSFSITTIYGQLTSVYQYPKPVLLILGGSTIAAIIIGFIYGKSNRIWCKYLCPVTGVFAALAKLAPHSFKPNRHEWRIYEGPTTSVNCPTILPIRTMNSNSECLMCGKCSNHREAIHLTKRSPNKEIVKYGKTEQSIWQSILIIFGLCGFAMAAFQWPNSFWLMHLRDIVESWFLSHNIMWVFNTNAPWWVFTNYPQNNDVFTWIFGFELIFYIVGIGFILGLSITILIVIALSIMGNLNKTSFNHLSQALIPLGACCVFIGLLSNTFVILEKYANIGFTWTYTLRAILLTLATLWSLYLARKIIRQYSTSFYKRKISLFIMLLTFLLINYSWFLVLHVWTLKSDSIPWNTLWVAFKLVN